MNGELYELTYGRGGNADVRGAFAIYYLQFMIHHSLFTIRHLLFITLTKGLIPNEFI
jgi:hypothetical protein